LIVEVPSTGNHFLEVAVVIDTAADVGVVFLKLLAGDNVISSVAVPVVVMLFEG
jgi:hypothetical protein